MKKRNIKKAAELLLKVYGEDRRMMETVVFAEMEEDTEALEEMLKKVVDECVKLME